MNTHIAAAWNGRSQPQPSSVVKETQGTLYVQQVFETVKKRNPHESEFHQAVKEIFDSLIPVFAKHPKYMEQGILRKNRRTRTT